MEGRNSAFSSSRKGVIFVNNQVQEQDKNEILEMDKLSTYSFDELEEGAAGHFAKAMSTVKAAFLKFKLTEDARKCMGEDVISTKIAAAKKVADKDMIIEQMKKELQRANADLQRANAEISTLSGEKSRLSEELSKVERKLLEASKEIMKVRKERESAKRSAALGEPELKRKRGRLSAPVKIEPSVVVESSTVDKDVVDSKMSAGRKGKELEDDSNRVYLQFIDHTGKSLYFKCGRDALMSKVMDAYCSRGDKDLKSCTFKYKDNMIEPYQTPNELQMVDGDQVLVVRRRRLVSGVQKQQQKNVGN